MTFWNEGTFTLTNSVQDLPIILKLHNFQSLEKALNRRKNAQVATFYFVQYTYLNIFFSETTWLIELKFYMEHALDKTISYLTGKNPVSWLAQLVFINLYVYLETGLNRSTS